jgi:hypothetical protein
MAAGGGSVDEISAMLMELKEFAAHGSFALAVIRATIGAPAALEKLLAAAQASGAGNSFDMLSAQNACNSNEQVVPMSSHPSRFTPFNKAIDALIARMIAAAEGLPPAPKVLPPCGHDSQHCRGCYCSHKMMAAIMAATEAAEAAAK